MELPSNRHNNEQKRPTSFRLISCTKKRLKSQKMLMSAKILMTMKKKKEAKIKRRFVVSCVLSARIENYHFQQNLNAFTVFNPLSANVGYIRHDTVVTSDSCNSGHSQNYVEILKFSCKSLKFSSNWYTKLCILVDPFLRNCVTKSNFRYFF